jgi:hypothetical protein
MTVVEGFIGNVKYSQDEFSSCKLSAEVESLLTENSCLNCVAYLIYKDSNGKLI